MGVGLYLVTGMGVIVGAVIAAMVMIMRRNVPAVFVMA